jgi:hypothetical protein
MSRSTWPPRCDQCGQFISYADMGAGRAWVWTPHGGPLDVDPPDDRWAHDRCWTVAKPEERALIQSIAWQGPCRTGAGAESVTTTAIGGEA